jgi:antitoxin component of RelBE/YafQ-DinJ toxin-antitoxin module
MAQTGTQDELTVRIDSDVRANAEVFFRSYGFTMSAGINALLKDAVDHGKMPANGKDEDDYIPKASTVGEILQMKADLDAGRIQATPWEDVERELDAIPN